MLIAALLAILAFFPVLLLYSPRFAFALLVLAIFLLYQKRVAGVRRSRVQQPPAPSRPVEWKDPWGTDGLGSR